MSLQVSVAVRVSAADDSQVYVNVVNGETVLSTPGDDTGTIELVRAVLDRLATDVIGRADVQVAELRDVIAKIEGKG